MAVDGVGFIVSASLLQWNLIELVIVQEPNNFQKYWNSNIVNPREWKDYKNMQK